MGVLLTIFCYNDKIRLLNFGNWVLLFLTYSFTTSQYRLNKIPYLFSNLYGMIPNTEKWKDFCSMVHYPIENNVQWRSLKINCNIAGNHEYIRLHTLLMNIIQFQKWCSSKISCFPFLVLKYSYMPCRICFTQGILNTLIHAINFNIKK